MDNLVNLIILNSFFDYHTPSVSNCTSLWRNYFVSNYMSFYNNNV